MGETQEETKCIVSQYCRRFEGNYTQDELLSLLGYKTKTDKIIEYLESDNEEPEEVSEEINAEPVDDAETGETDSDANVEASPEVEQ